MKKIHGRGSVAQTREPLRRSTAKPKPPLSSWTFLNFCKLMVIHHNDLERVASLLSFSENGISCVITSSFWKSMRTCLGNFVAQGQVDLDLFRRLLKINFIRHCLPFRNYRRENANWNNVSETIVAGWQTAGQSQLFLKCVYICEQVRKTTAHPGWQSFRSLPAKPWGFVAQLVTQRSRGGLLASCWQHLLWVMSPVKVWQPQPGSAGTYFKFWT